MGRPDNLDAPFYLQMDYLILALATWRISSLLVNEDVPWQIFGRFRSLAGVRYDENSERIVTGFWSELIICIWCTSVWVGLILMTLWGLWPQPTLWIAVPLALSAGAILIDKVTQ